MKRDLVFILMIISFVLVLFLGTFIRGIETESIIENRKLEDFPTFNVRTFFDATYQESMESALSDQLLFSENAKSIYNNLKNKNLDLVVYSLQKLESIQLEDLAKKATATDNSNKTLNPSRITSIEANPSNTETFNDSSEIASNVNKDTEFYTNEPPLENKSSDLPKVIQKELDPKPTIILRKPEYTSFELALRPRGNNIIEIEESEHLVYPKRTVNEGLSLMESKADNYNRTVHNYPNLNFFCYYIESDVDVDFVNGQISHDVVEKFFSLLDPSIKTSALYVNSPKDYQNFFYKTDHHWNVEGQLQGYKDIIALLKGEFEPLLNIEILPIEGLFYNGYKSRKSNDYSIKDEFKILMADLNTYTTYINNEEGTYGRKEDYLAGNYSASTGFNYYRDCNGVDYGIVEYDFNQPEKGNLLCYVESFSNPINAFIASHYNKTYFVDYRHYQPTFGNSLDFGNFVNEHAIDDVLFAGYYHFYVNYMFKVSD